MLSRYALVLVGMVIAGGAPGFKDTPQKREKVEETFVRREFSRGSESVYIDVAPSGRRNVHVVYFEQGELGPTRYTLTDEGGDKAYEWGRELQVWGTLLKFQPDMKRENPYDAKRLDALTPRANEVRASVTEDALVDLIRDDKID